MIKEILEYYNKNNNSDLSWYFGTTDNPSDEKSIIEQNDKIKFWKEIPMNTSGLESIQLRNKIIDDLKELPIVERKPNTNGTISHHTVFLYAI
jgi:hypothetical protein